MRQLVNKEEETVKFTGSWRQPLIKDLFSGVTRMWHVVLKYYSRERKIALQKSLDIQYYFSPSTTSMFFSGWNVAMQICQDVMSSHHVLVICPHTCSVSSCLTTWVWPSLCQVAKIIDIYMYKFRQTCIVCKRSDTCRKTWTIHWHM